MDRKEWNLLAICAAGERGLSPVQLQKVLFLLGAEMPSAAGTNFYKFAPYHYGPFDSSVYSDASALSKEGLVTITSAPYGNFEIYRATGPGYVHAAEVEMNAPAKAVAYLRSVVDWAKTLSFPALVRAIYQKYPEMKQNSVFNG